MKIQGTAAIVTGGGSGLGEATARELARLGATVAVLDVNLANAQKVATEIGGVACQADVTDTAPAAGAKDGVIALQLHQGPPMTIQFKDVQLKTLP